MKILIIRTWPDELNINNYNSQEIGLAKSLINNGHICDIVLYTKGQNKIDYYAFNDKKIKIYYIKAINFFKNAIFDKAIFNIIDNYDVIQTAEYDQIFNIKLYKHCPEKLVIFHGPYKSEFTKGYKKKIMISDFLYKFFREYKNTPVISKSELATKFLYEKGFKNVFTIGVGLDDSRFTNVVSNKKLDELITSKNNCKYMLYIGKIEERRNIKFLVDRFYDYNKTNQNSKLILVGKGTR